MLYLPYWATIWEVLQLHPLQSHIFLVLCMIDFLTQDYSVFFFDHVCRNHNFKDIERYKQMSENNWTFSELLKNRPDLSHSKRRVFGNSYVVQWWDYPINFIYFIITIIYIIFFTKYFN